MTDRELLEAAARAAGMRVWRGSGFQSDMLFTEPARPDPEGKVTGVEWNPLADDGDALRLAVKLRLNIIQFDDGVQQAAWEQGAGLAFEPAADDYAATRRAIVRAAAAMTLRRAIWTD